MLVPDMLPLRLSEAEFLFFEGEIATHLFCVYAGGEKVKVMKWTLPRL